MSWQQVSSRRWERPVDGLEGYFVFTADITASLCDGREHYTFTSALKIAAASFSQSTAEQPPRSLIEALKHAWKQMRFEQPQIATTVEGMKKVYEIPDDDALEQWLDATFIVSSASNGDELYASTEPLKQAMLYYLPNSSELVLRCPHHTVDGIGHLMFWDRLLEILKSPASEIVFGDETRRLAPAMEKVLGYAEEPTPKMREQAAALFWSWGSNIPGIGPPSGLGVAPSGRCQREEIVFTAETTAALIKSCQEHNVKFTALVHAAYIKAIEKYADPNSKLGEYVTANQFNLRPYLPEPYNTGNHAAAVYYTPLPYRVALPATYWDLARDLNTHYHTAFKEDRELLEIKGHFARVLCETVQTPEFLAQPLPKDALTSSLGVIERYVRRDYGDDIRVLDVKVGIDVVMGMSMLLFYTFRDQFRLVYCFNDGFEKTEDIRKYLDETKSILMAELLGDVAQE